MEFVNWDGATIPKWEYHLLLDIGAISRTGIISDTPIIKIVEKDGDSKQIDFTGNYQQMKQKVDELNQSKIRGEAKIGYYPKRRLLSSREFSRMRKRASVRGERGEKPGLVPRFVAQDPVSWFVSSRRPLYAGGCARGRSTGPRAPPERAVRPPAAWTRRPRRPLTAPR